MAMSTRAFMNSDRACEAAWALGGAGAGATSHPPGPSSSADAAGEKANASFRRERDEKRNAPRSPYPILEYNE